MTAIGIVGMGYVGGPLATAFADAGHSVVGYDIDENKIETLRNEQRDLVTRTVDARTTFEFKQAGGSELEYEDDTRAGLEYSSDPSCLRGCRVIITAVPTPLTPSSTPDLSILHSAARTIGEQLRPRTTVVLESTVYPGVTRNEFVPEIERASGMTLGNEFDVGYSPERVTPGESHELRNTVKPVSGNTDAVRAELMELYDDVVEELFPAPSIEAAEAAKCLENTQRDVNIALINQFAMACSRIDWLDYDDVLTVADTKWNFQRYDPGLVEGHCIPIDPHYLIDQLERHGASASLMREARSVNESVVDHVLQLTIGAFAERERLVDGPTNDRVLALGISYKPNSDDIRSTAKCRLFDGLRNAGLDPVGYDPHVDPVKAADAFDIEVVSSINAADVTGALVLTGHDVFADLSIHTLVKSMSERPVVVDLPRMFSEPADSDIVYRRL